MLTSFGFDNSDILTMMNGSPSILTLVGGLECHESVDIRKYSSAWFQFCLKCFTLLFSLDVSSSARDAMRRLVGHSYKIISYMAGSLLSSQKSLGRATSVANFSPGSRQAGRQYIIPLRFCSVTARFSDLTE
ncbi:hypothetical protein IFM89_018364 [Coptis chinensis]|uniref:Uncharacterized protein n=1 Tax=Coptis chinensis TaxID=261450 RepID=A0A835LRY0_9MAGN|nr:hypothetical protein IFM89_018364 [Coptis chinensis]